MEAEIGGRVTNYQGPVFCCRVTDVLLASAVAFYILNTDLDRYMHVLKGRSCTSTNAVCMRINA